MSKPSQKEQEGIRAAVGELWNVIAKHSNKISPDCIVSSVALVLGSATMHPDLRKVPFDVMQKTILENIETGKRTIMEQAKWPDKKVH